MSWRRRLRWKEAKDDDRTLERQRFAMTPLDPLEVDRLVRIAMFLTFAIVAGVAILLEDHTRA